MGVAGASEGSTKLSTPTEVAALDLLAKGLPIALCDGKKPVTFSPNGKDWHRETWNDYLVKMTFLRHEGRLNVGIILGPEANLIDIEADSPAEESAFAALFQGCVLPMTPTFRSSRGKHRIFQFDKRLEETKRGIISYPYEGAKLGVRIGANCKAAQTVIPPSINADGTEREWEISFEDCEPAALPEVVVQRLLEASKRDERPAITGPLPDQATDSGVSACMTAMRRVKMDDHNDGSKRLFTYACRCVEFNLSGEQAILAIRKVAESRPFPGNFDDDDILARLADAEKEVTRGAMLVDDDSITNALIEYVEDDDGKEKKVITPLVMEEVLRRIRAKTEDWPRRVDGCVFVDDHAGARGVCWLNSTSAFFGWLQTRVGKVEWHGKILGAVNREETFAELQRTSTAYLAIEELPHEPKIVGHYYACENLEPGDGQALHELLDRFAPETPIDRDLLQAYLMTAIWGGPGGTRPAFLITSDHGRGVGKTKAGELLASVVGGTISFSAKDDIGEIRSRLLSPAGLSKRVTILDNLKTLRFSWAELESLITAPMVSGKRMYVGEAQRPNVLTWVLTLNGASLSTDMAQRCVIIKLKRPQRDGEWEESVAKFVSENRQRIIADLVGKLRVDPVKLQKFSRWATWERAILARLPEPSEAQAVIEERQGQVDIEADEAAVIEEFFEAQLKALGYDTETDCVFVPSEFSARWLDWATNDKRSPIVAGRVLGQFCREGRFKSIQQNKTNAWGRGFIWWGQKHVGGSVFVDLPSRFAEKKLREEREKEERKQAGQFK
jgi:hypothetical protein